MSETVLAALARTGLPARLHDALTAGLAAVEPTEETLRPLLYALERAVDAGVIARLPDDPRAGAALARVTYAAPFLLHHAAAGAERLPKLLADLASPAVLPW